MGEFLEHRTFKVKMGTTKSVTQVQKNGIPQGSVLSVSLFLVPCIPKLPGFSVSFYMDDLQVSYCHTDMQKIRQQLHSVLKACADTNGFAFSGSKTKLMHFRRQETFIDKPILKLHNSELLYASEKFSGSSARGWPHFPEAYPRTEGKMH